MKKFLSFAVAVAMVATTIPATAFASSDLRVSRQITAESGDYLYDGKTQIEKGTDSREAPWVTLKVDGNFKAEDQEFRLKVTNADWLDETNGHIEDAAKVATVKDKNGNSLTGKSDGTSAKEKALIDVKTAVSELSANGGSGNVEVDSTKVIEIADSLIKEAAGTKIVAADWKTNLLNLLPNGDLLGEAVKTGTPATDWNALANALETYHDSVIKAETAAKALTDELTPVDGTNYTLEKATEKLLQKYNDAMTSDLTWIGNNPNDATEITMSDLETAGVSGLAALLKYNGDTGTAKTALTTAATNYFNAVSAKDSADSVVTAIKNSVSKAASKLNSSLGSNGSGSATLPSAEDIIKSYNDKGDTAFRADMLKTYGIANDSKLQKVIDAIVVYNKADDTTPTTNGVKVSISKLTDSQISVVITGNGYTLQDEDEISFPLYTKMTGGTATVEVDPRDSEFSSESKTFGITAEGNTTTYTEGTKNFYDGEAIKPFFIEETTPGTFDANKNNGEITIKLNSGFKWGYPLNKQDWKDCIKFIEGGAGSTLEFVSADIDEETLTVKFKGSSKSKAATLKFTDMVVLEDGADFGTVAKITVSGAGISKKTIEVGTYSDFGVSLTAESKDLPVIYAGSYAQTGENDNEVLKVTLKETVNDSLTDNRKLIFRLPEGVKFADVEVKKADHWKGGASTLENVMLTKGNIDGNELTIPAGDVLTDDKSKVEADIIFYISADPAFTGDVDLTVTGPAISNEEITTTVATVKAPITVQADVNEVKIDYRNVEIGDITITEAEAGLWEKGDYITLKVEDMQFETGITAEVVSGDIKLEKLDGDNVKVDKKRGTVRLQVKTASSTDPAEIKLSGIQLYLERSLPAGDYALQVVGSSSDDDNTPIPKYDFNRDGKGSKNTEKDLVFANYNGDSNLYDDVNTIGFDTDTITVLKDYVKVVTAGRDQDDATFTTTITVPIGSDTITAGTSEIKVDSPAYINADGYTMLPVRAITEALNGVAVVKWDDATKTATISFGQRVFSMTVGSKTMNMNGVPTALLAAPEIKNERIFLPLRDLGYALGLSDSKIKWDAATSTATLN